MVREEIRNKEYCLFLKENNQTIYLLKKLEPDLMHILNWWLEMLEILFLRLLDIFW